KSGGKASIREASQLGFHVFIVGDPFRDGGECNEEQLLFLHNSIVEESHASGGNIDDIRSCGQSFRSSAGHARYDSIASLTTEILEAWQLAPEQCLMITSSTKPAIKDFKTIEFPGGNVGAFLHPLLVSNFGKTTESEAK